MTSCSGHMAFLNCMGFKTSGMNSAISVIFVTHVS